MHLCVFIGNYLHQGRNVFIFGLFVCLSVNKITQKFVDEIIK